MIDRELLISLHQKVDRNHDWVKRQFTKILSYMAQTHSSVKKVHQYTHHTYQNLDALMREVITPEDLSKLELQKPPIPAIRPPRQFRRCTTPPPTMDSYSSNQEITAEEAEDTTVYPHTTTTCLRRDSLSLEASLWGVSFSFPPFCSFNDKG